jgi:hypothetical protein
MITEACRDGFVQRIACGESSDASRIATPRWARALATKAAALGLVAAISVADLVPRRNVRAPEIKTALDIADPAWEDQHETAVGALAPRRLAPAWFVAFSMMMVFCLIMGLLSLAPETTVGLVSCDGVMQ